MQQVQTNSEQLSPVRRPAWFVIGFLGSMAIALAAVIRRLIALVHPSEAGLGPARSLDAVFSSHALLTCFHIVPASAFVCLAGLFVLRRKSGGLMEAMLYLFGIVTGLTAYVMSSYAIGGWVERSAVLVFNTWFLISLGMSARFGLRGDRAAKRRWMNRAVGVLLGIATARPVMGVFFATSARTHLGPRDFFGLAFWIGFSINTILTEAFLRSRARRSREDREDDHPFSAAW